MTRGRKRKVIFEKFDNKPANIYFNSIPIIPQYFEPFKKNHFTVELEGNNNEKIEPYKICGYHIEDFSDKKIIKISSTLIIGEWIEKFKKMTMVKVFFLDTMGSPCELFDYDIMYDGISIQGNYQSNDILMSTFKYIILD